MSVLAKKPSLPRRVFWGVGVVVLAAGFASGFTSRALSACQPFPKVGVWQNLTHDSVRTQVEREYDDDWQSYIARLEVYGNKLRRIQAKGKSVRITRGGRNVRLQGDALTRFLVQVDKRIAVTRCLAENQAENQDVADFSTAAGVSDDDRSGKAAVGKPAGKAAARLKPDKCGPLPHVAWWKFKTHDSIAAYVVSKYRGNWTPYIKSWKRRLRKLQRVYGRGSSVKTKTGVTLKGATLAGYIEKIQTKIAVTRCLAEKSGSSKT